MWRALVPNVVRQSNRHPQGRGVHEQKLCVHEQAMRASLSLIMFNFERRFRTWVISSILRNIRQTPLRWTKFPVRRHQLVHVSRDYSVKCSGINCIMMLQFRSGDYTFISWLKQLDYLLWQELKRFYREIDNRLAVVFPAVKTISSQGLTLRLLFMVLSFLVEFIKTTIDWWTNLWFFFSNRSFAWFCCLWKDVNVSARSIVVYVLYLQNKKNGNGFYGVR